MATANGIELKKFGETFSDRLSQDQLNYALGYIDFGEEPLAFETFCDYLCENDVYITQSEYEQICLFNSAFDNYLDRRVLVYLKELIL